MFVKRRLVFLRKMFRSLSQGWLYSVIIRFVSRDKFQVVVGVDFQRDGRVQIIGVCSKLYFLLILIISVLCLGVGMSLAGSFILFSIGKVYVQVLQIIFMKVKFEQRLRELEFSGVCGFYFRFQDICLVFFSICWILVGILWLYKCVLRFSKGKIVFM